MLVLQRRRARTSSAPIATTARRPRPTARFAVSLNLNDDFEGGELVFPEYAGVKVSPPAGAAAVFSCSVLHRGAAGDARPALRADDVLPGQKMTRLLPVAVLLAARERRVGAG